MTRVGAGRRFAIAALVIAVALPLAGCDQYGKFGGMVTDSVAAQQALDALMPTLKADAGVKDAGYDLRSFGTPPGATVTLTFSDRDASHWTAAAQQLADAATQDAFAAIPLDVAFAADGLEFRPAPDGLNQVLPGVAPATAVRLASTLPATLDDVAQVASLLHTDLTLVLGDPNGEYWIAVSADRTSAAVRALADPSTHDAVDSIMTRDSAVQGWFFAGYSKQSANPLASAKLMQEWAGVLTHLAPASTCFHDPRCAPDAQGDYPRQDANAMLMASSVGGSVTVTSWDDPLDAPAPGTLDAVKVVLGLQRSGTGLFAYAHIPAGSQSEGRVDTATFVNYTTGCTTAFTRDPGDEAFFDWLTGQGITIPEEQRGYCEYPVGAGAAPTPTPTP